MTQTLKPGLTRKLRRTLIEAQGERVSIYDPLTHCFHKNKIQEDDEGFFVIKGKGTGGKRRSIAYVEIPLKKHTKTLPNYEEAYAVLDSYS